MTDQSSQRFGHEPYPDKPALLDYEIGEEIIKEIVHGGLVRVDAQAAVVFVWSQNAAEQIGQCAREIVGIATKAERRPQ